MDLLGLPCEQALEALRARGIEDVRITEARAPRGGREGGTLRVVRVRDGGRELVAARFLDTIVREGNARIEAE